MAGEPRPKTVVGGEGAFLRRADADSHLVGDDDDINTFGSGESGESHFIEHTFESPAMQRVAAAVRRRPSFDGTARYTSDRVYPGWILDHRHFEEAKHLVKENRLRDALQNSPKERTDEDVEVLTMFLMAVWPTTLRLGEARVNEIARCANLRRFHQGQYIVTEGEVGLTFYIIVSGAADVEKHGEYLATLKMGHSFGEASLGAGAPPRNASCIASSATTELLELRKTDYDKIMKSYQDAEQRRAFRCLKSVPMFRNWAKSRLTRLCGLVRRVDFKAGALIIKQNDPPDNVYFVLEGAVLRGNQPPERPVRQKLQPLHLDHIEVDSADFWTDRWLPSSSRRTAEEFASKHSITRTLKSG